MDVNYAHPPAADHLDPQLRGNQGRINSGSRDPQMADLENGGGGRGEKKKRACNSRSRDSCDHEKLSAATLFILSRPTCAEDEGRKKKGTHISPESLPGCSCKNFSPRKGKGGKKKKKIKRKAPPIVRRSDEYDHYRLKGAAAVLPFLLGSPHRGRKEKEKKKKRGKIWPGSSSPFLCLGPLNLRNAAIL